MNNYNILKDKNKIDNTPKKTTLQDIISNESSNNKNKDNNNLLKQNSDLIKQIEKLKKDAQIKVAPPIYVNKTVSYEKKDDNRNNNRLYKSMKVSNMAKQLESVLNRSKTLDTENNKKDETPITHAPLDLSADDEGNNRMSYARSGRKKKSQKQYLQCLLNIVSSLFSIIYNICINSWFLVK